MAFSAPWDLTQPRRLAGFLVMNWNSPQQTYRKRDRQITPSANIQTERQTNYTISKHTDRETDRQITPSANIQKERQTGRLYHQQTYRQRDRQADYTTSKHTKRQRDRHITSDHVRHFSSRCDIYKVVKVVHRNRSDNYCNRSDTRLSILLLLQHTHTHTHTHTYARTHANSRTHTPHALPMCVFFVCLKTNY